MGLVALASTVLGSTTMADACPSRNKRSGSISLLISTTVCSSSTCVAMLAKVRLSLLVLLAAAARSNENFTLCALKGSPFWNFTPRLSLKV